MSNESHNAELHDGEDSGHGFLDALVEAERASGPTADRERETWKRVVASVAVGGAPPMQPSSISGPTATLTSVWSKIVLGVVVGGVVAAAAYRLSADPELEPAPHSAARSGAESREPPPPSAPSPPPAAQPAPAVPAPSPSIQTPPDASSAKQARAAAPDPAAVATAERTSELAEETRLLARARARLRAGSPTDALTPLAEHARRFPRGQLAEDRMVLRAQALCESGELQAGLQQAAALRKAFPSSSHLPRVERSCE